MMMWCPLLLIGYAFPVILPWHQKRDIAAPMIEVQTCERGFGAHVKASGAGLYGLGLHYGLNKTWGDWSATIQPHAGLSYADHPIETLPLRKQFELGAELHLGYKQARVGLSYWHLSNAGLRQPNIGLDMFIIQAGWAFNLN
jgi:hypothetical protein